MEPSLGFIKMSIVVDFTVSTLSCTSARVLHLVASTCHSQLYSFVWFRCASIAFFEPIKRLIICVAALLIAHSSNFPTWVAVPSAVTATKRTNPTSSRATAVVCPNLRLRFMMSEPRKPLLIFSPSLLTWSVTRSSKSPPRLLRPAVLPSTST